MTGTVKTMPAPRRSSARRNSLLAAVLLAATVLPPRAVGADQGQASGADAPEAAVQPRPRIGLVLSGGGARGIIGNTTSIRTELFQPLSYARTFSVAPYAGGYLQNENVDLGDEVIAQYDTRKAGLGLDLGYELERFGEVRLGYRRGTVSQTREIGVVFPNIEADIGAILLRGAVDRLDNWAFPSSGCFARGVYTCSREGLGASEDCELLDIRLQKAFSFGSRHRVLANVRYANSFGSTMPFYPKLRVLPVSRQAVARVGPRLVSSRDDLAN